MTNFYKTMTSSPSVDLSTSDYRYYFKNFIVWFQNMNHLILQNGRTTSLQPDMHQVARPKIVTFRWNTKVFIFRNWAPRRLGCGMFLQKICTSLLRRIRHYILRYFKYHIHSREKLKFHGISLFRPLALYGERVITLLRWARQTR